MPLASRIVDEQPWAGQEQGRAGERGKSKGALESGARTRASRERGKSKGAQESGARAGGYFRRWTVIPVSHQNTATCKGSGQGSNGRDRTSKRVC